MQEMGLGVELAATPGRLVGGAARNWRICMPTDTPEATTTELPVRRSVVRVGLSRHPNHYGQ
jgi:hypothetical protein